MGRGSVEFLDA